MSLKTLWGALCDCFVPKSGGGINRLLALAQAWIRGGVLWLISSTRSGLGAKVCSRLKGVGLALRLHTPILRERTSLCQLRASLLPLRTGFSVFTSRVTRQLTYMRSMGIRPLRLELFLRTLGSLNLQRATLFLSTKVLKSCIALVKYLTRCGSFLPPDRSSLNAKEVCHA